MKKSIIIDHICRVEGSGGITVNIKDRKNIEVHSDIFEGLRLLEAIVLGKSYVEVTPILSRICAICSAVHTVCSLMAIEDAFKINVTHQTKLLRELLVLGGNIESHALHLFCLVLPDFLGYPNAIAMAEKYSKEVKIGLELKKLGNTIQEVIGGRAIHPVNATLGGFGKVPDEEKLNYLKEQLKKGLEQSLSAMNLIYNLELPNLYVSPNIFVSLLLEHKYSLFGDKIILSTGDIKDVSMYKEVCKEIIVPYSHAKQSLFKDKPFMVGALARIVLNGNKLSEESKKIKEKLKFTSSPDNALQNNFAQAVELVYSIERTIEIIDELLNTGMKQEKPLKFKVKSGTGTSAVEAPRGTLYHSYSFDEKGRVINADVITPTAQNLANIEKDIHAAVENLINEPNESLIPKIEMIVRAYDPCISCSVH